ncbi:MAG: GTPase ObgE [Dehalococcoidales bacterium]|nr:GTPase ObgE [Dehalococcoidales bacterium]
MLDKVELHVKAGDGGSGAVTFRREKFVPFGGPYGGDGGKGGDVVIKAEASVSTLRAYKHKRHFKAMKGQPGMTKNKHGANGENLYLSVPPGTLVYRKYESGDPELVEDLKDNGDEVVVARGGNGGYGNTHYATATNQAPRIAQPGITGQERTIILELRLIADAGIIGYPNAGKSSLLAALSAASPRIADYPFTTLEPVLGVVNVEGDAFVMAEIPGLIDGAHAGRGLGHDFLRHAMRTRVLVHLLDGTSDSPLDNMIRVNNELSMFDASLAKRPQVVAVNKVDLPEVKKRKEEIRSSFRDASIDTVFVSAVTGTGLDDLIARIWELLKTTGSVSEVTLKAPPRIFKPRPVDISSAVRVKSNTYLVNEPELDRILGSFDLSDPQEWPEFYSQLDRLGINELLKSAGARSGDTVITGNKNWKWYADEYRPDGRNI